MGLDLNRFEQAKFKQREEEVKVPELKQFFGEEEKPVWKVRSLAGFELAKANEAMQRNRDMEAIVEGLAGATQDKKVDAIKNILGITDKVPDDIVRRITLLRLGSIDPECSEEIAVKLSEAFPVTFYNLTNKILQLTGQGKRLGESKGSGKTPKSSSQ